MSEQRVQIAYHCKIDPAKLGNVTSADVVPLPDQITRTVSVGEELTTEKVDLGTLSPWDRKALREAVYNQIPKATRVAKPVGAAAPSSADPVAGSDTEMSAF